MTSSFPAPESPLAIVASGLSKHFPGVTALDGVSLGFPAGRVTAVVGENGAGKSTLMTILAGLQRPDAGTVTVGNHLVSSFTPHALLVEHGVALVPQEIALCRERTVAENVLLGREPGVLPSRRTMVEETRKLLASIEATINPRRRAGSLGVAEQQIVLIVRALARQCRILILDEPTAALTQDEVDRLFRLLRRLREGGTTIIYVSHRMPEVFALSDGIHVLRDGAHVASYVTEAVDPGTVVRSTVGRELGERVASSPRPLGDVALKVAGLTGKSFLHADLVVRRGEIVGLAGLPDSGRGELVAALFGATPSSGDVVLDGRKLRLRAPADAINAGIGYVPAERRSQGIFPAMNVSTNLALLDLPKATHFGIVNKRALARIAESRLQQFDIRGGASAKITQLSGGNQQKVILARWLARNPSLLLLDEPTRGVDVGAKAEIYARLAEAAAAGSAILMSSSDLPELLRTCDRIVVMAQGEVVGESPAASATEDQIMALATGLDAVAA